MGKRLNDTAAIAGSNPANSPRTHGIMRPEFANWDRQGMAFGSPGQFSKDPSPDKEGAFAGVSRVIKGD